MATPVKKEVTETLEQRRAKWYTKVKELESKKFCIVVGTSDKNGMSDGTGKTALTVSYGIDYLKKNPTKNIFIIDIDCSVDYIAKYYTEYTDRILVFQPNFVKEDNTADFTRCIKEINAVCGDIAKNYEELNIGMIIFDGLTPFKKMCEMQMRMDKFITTEGKVNTLFWQTRNNHFFKSLNTLRRVPIHKFFIAQDDFLAFNQTIDMGGTVVKVGALQKSVSEMCLQRILCSKKENSNGDYVLTAKIDKAKDAPEKLNKEYKFMIVNDKGVRFNTDKVFEGL